MSKLGELIAKCNSLGLRTVLGEGAPTSKLWIVGEAPGEFEEKALRPFCGPSGWFLDPVLLAAGINRGACYVTNVSPVRPPKNEWSRLEETGVTYVECNDALWEQVRLFKPNAILSLGNPSLLSTTGKSGITEWRGTVLHNGSCKVVPSFHPAYVLRMGDKTSKKEREGFGGVKYTYGSARVTLILDCKRAKAESESVEFEERERDLKWGLPPAENAQWIEFFMHRPVVAFDIETKGKWADIISFAVSFGPSISMPTSSDGVRDLLATHKGLVAQNGAFDMTLLQANGVEVGKIKADTMLAHHLLYSELPHDLSYLASVYCRMTEQLHPKGWDAPEVRPRYNALHAAVTGEVWVELEKEMAEVGYV